MQTLHEKLERFESGCRGRFILSEHSSLQTVTQLRQPRIEILGGEAIEAGLSTTDRGM